MDSRTTLRRQLSHVERELFRTSMLAYLEGTFGKDETESILKALFDNIEAHGSVNEETLELALKAHFGKYAKDVAHALAAA